MKRSLSRIGRNLLPEMLVLVFFATGCGDSGGPGARSHYAANVVTVTEANVQAEVLSATRPVLVDFWAAWCAPCKALVPTINEIATEYEGRVKVGAVNVDEVPALAERYGIQGLPTLLIFKNGKVVDQVLGLIPKKELTARLDRVLAESTGSPATPAPAAK